MSKTTKGEKMKIEYERLETQEEVKKHIKECEEERHIQQVAYSSHLDALTQICFSCGKVRSTWTDR